ncbi:MAG: hypothetical protein AAF959_02145 [Cyanobacteria bacterium P01_D01_bin.56]
MRASFWTLLLFMALGAAASSSLCAYLLPLSQVDQRCYWWRDVIAELGQAQ